MIFKMKQMLMFFFSFFSLIEEQKSQDMLSSNAILSRQAFDGINGAKA